jgi:glyoxylase-like metal-dependent hydrolase (beta-lactamase superfamily II)
MALPAAKTSTRCSETAEQIAEVGFLKSYERFSKERLGNPPAYPFLTPDQVATAGEKPWTRLSEHLFLTGNTYALSSADGALLVVDPFGPKIAEQVHALQQQYKLGPVEVVVISHAHNDHYTGVFQLPGREKFQVWMLDLVARPLAEPFYYCAPYLDARPLRADRVLKSGQDVAWREYKFRVGHFPGQSYFSMGIEAKIDGRACYLTADNFFHADQFSGSGGWSGRNRSWPTNYAASAEAVLASRPEWVLAEHGGPFAFDAEDFRRRVQWGTAAAKAADAVSPAGNHLHDWHPCRVRIEPLMQRATPGGKVKAQLVVDNLLPRTETLAAELDGRNLLSPFQRQVTVEPRSSGRFEFEIEVSPQLPAGRHLFPVVIKHGNEEDGADVFVILEVVPE